MAIKLAFSTVACPDWTLEDVARRAQEMGYQGVELRTLGANSGGSASGGIAADPALTDPAKVAGVFKAFGVEPVCLSTSVAFNHRSVSDGRAALRDARQSIDLASAIGCAYVRFFGYEVKPGDSRQSAMQRIAERVTTLLDYAADRGVQVLLENAGSFNTAKEWWWLFNLVEHPMLGLCWNVANAAGAGEPPSVSVPTLNHRIVLGKVKDTVVGEGSGFVPLGEGTVGVDHFVRRLLGIGFDGYISVEHDRAWLTSLAPAEEYLPDALTRLKAMIEKYSNAQDSLRPKANGPSVVKAK
jgi:sugar phosphate isomerase/epimerase